MTRYTLFLTFSLLSLLASAQSKHEVRAAWISTAYGLDWPTVRAVGASGVERQKRELTDYLDLLQAARFNTVLLQVRLRGDVLYPSALEPFSDVLTGRTGANPGYDPLAFAIEECHKRGMECHAWMVAIPLGGRKQVAALGTRSVTRKRKEICVTFRGDHYLNPGHPDTKEYLFDLAREVVSRYDVDGVQFDYLRYPENGRSFPDRKEFRRYGRGRSLEQWRRDNLTETLRYIYKGIKALKPWVKVSVCPVGKADDTSRYPSRGWNAYGTVNQDTQAWLSEGIVDQLYPMMYFQGNNFYPFALDWQEQSHGRQIVPGLGIYFLHPREGNWKRDEVERQIHFIRRHGLAGEAFYRMRFLADEDTQGLYPELERHFYTYPALQPPMTWMDSLPPTAPTMPSATENIHGYVELSWQPSTDNDTRNAPTYVVYASNELPVDITRTENIVATGIQGTTYVYAPIYPWERRKHFAVTAVDRYGNESQPASVGHTIDEGDGNHADGT